MNNTKNNHNKHWDTRGRTGTLTKNGYKVGQKYGVRNYEHRTIVENTIGRKLDRSEHIHHKDGNKLNNDISNLEIISASEHIREHALKNGLGRINRPTRIGNQFGGQLSKESIDIIVKMRGEHKTITEIAKYLNKSYPTVWKYCKQYNINKHIYYGRHKTSKKGAVEQ